MKFCIFGAGGTGGVLAAYLAMAGNDVTLIARGKHLAAIKEQGLTLHTNHRGTEVIKSLTACTAAEYEDVPDVCFVCVKYYNIEDAIDFAREKLGKDTRTEWAQRRMYAMIADYTRAPNAKTMSDIRAFAERYGIEIPYEKEIK